jgi:hypothetical protein
MVRRVLRSVKINAGLGERKLIVFIEGIRGVYGGRRALSN